MIALDTLGAELRPLEAKHMEQTKQLEQITLQVSQAMENYNGIVSNNGINQGGRNQGADFYACVHRSIHYPRYLLHGTTF